MQGKNLAKWMVTQSDYLICYMYQDFKEIELESARRAGRKGFVKALYVSTHEAMESIRENIKNLTEREQFSLIERDKKRTSNSIGVKLGLSGARVLQLERHARNKLRRWALEKYEADARLEKSGKK